MDYFLKEKNSKKINKLLFFFVPTYAFLSFADSHRQKNDTVVQIVCCDTFKLVVAPLCPGPIEFISCIELSSTFDPMQYV